MYIYITWDGSSTDFIKRKPFRIILHQFGSKVQCTSSCYFYIPFTDVVLTDCPNPGSRILMIESKVTILIGLWCLTPLSIFYIVAVNFIGGGNINIFKFMRKGYVISKENHFSRFKGV